MKAIFVSLCLFVCLTSSAQLKIYDYPEGKEGLTLMHDFSVTADGKPVKTYMCEVNPHKKVQKASWCQFQFAGGGGKYVRMQVAYHGGKVDSAVVRPLSKDIKPTLLNDSTIQFDAPAATTGRGYALTVEVNGDREHNLHVFVDPEETETFTPPSPDSKDSIIWSGTGEPGSALDVFAQNARLIYFGPGIHKPKDLPSTEIKIPSNTTVYIAPGAIIRARLIVDHAQNVRIIGRGLILNPLRGVEITFSKNVEVDGLTVINPQHYTVFGGQSEQIKLSNIRSFSRHPWSDGIDLMCCKKVNIQDVFLRNNDDAIALYNHRWWYWGGTNDVQVARATIFSDLAHPFNFGTHGDDRAVEGEYMRRIRVQDCDILSADGDGIFSVRCGDQNRIEDIHFSNIRIEDVVQSRLFNVQTYFSGKYNRAPGDFIRNVWFSDISFNGDASRLGESQFKSYDEQHPVSDIHFKNIRINGELQYLKTVK